jgi:calcineurin-like phosphoesterase family protein
MTNWFSSDLHFRHRLVAGIRGFTALDERGQLVPDRDAHDEAIIRNWNGLVKPGDVVWLLGDAGIGNETEVLTLVARLHGRKQLVAGNHDSCHPMHRAAWKKQRKWLEVFESVQASAVVNLAGQQDVLLSHFPYSGDHTSDDRYTQWRLPDEGLPLLHGHIHSRRRRTGSNQVHAGLDAWDLKPASEIGILREFRKPWIPVTEKESEEEK